MSDQVNEIWKPIQGFRDYFISNMARVKSLRKIRTNTERILKPYLGANGYLYVNLYQDGKVTHKYIHRLVLEAFIPRVHGCNDCDHINTIRTDNRIENLRWASRFSNMRNPITNNHQSESASGARNYNFGRTGALCRGSIPVRCKELNKVFESIKIAAMELNAKPSSIRRVLKGKRQTTRGYHFEIMEK